MKKGVTNIFFWIGSIGLAAALFISGRPYMETLLKAGYSVEGTGWVEMFRYCVINEKGLLFVPICAPLSAGAQTEMELKSRYALFCCSRTGKKRYYAKKAAECIVSGGLTVCFAYIVILVVAYIGLREMPMQLSTVGPGVAASVVLSAMLLGFLNGAFWTLIGSMAAVLTKNQHLAIALPFVLYYTLTVFQTRYYTTLYFFSPRYWAAPVHYGNVWCIGVLLILCIIVTGGFVLAVERRLRHA